jgi:hypothetical protein
MPDSLDPASTRQGLARVEESRAEQKGPGGLQRELENVVGLFGEDLPR